MTRQLPHWTDLCGRSLSALGRPRGLSRCTFPTCTGNGARVRVNSILRSRSRESSISHVQGRKASPVASRQPVPAQPALRRQQLQVVADPMDENAGGRVGGGRACSRPRRLLCCAVERMARARRLRSSCKHSVHNKQTQFTTNRLSSQQTDSVHNKQTQFTTNRLSSQQTDPVHNKQTQFTTNRLSSQQTDSVHNKQTQFTTNRLSSQQTDSVHNKQTQFTTQTDPSRAPSRAAFAGTDDIAQLLGPKASNGYLPLPLSHATPCSF